MFWDNGLEHETQMRAADFVYIPPRCTDVPVNMSGTQPATALVARTGPKEQESVVLLPALDALPHLRAGRAP
jgi:uncharacterized RmlC-like cupin family protein